MPRGFVVRTMPLMSFMLFMACGGQGDGLRVTSETVQPLVSGEVFHSLHVTTDGKVWSWGWNGWGQLGDGTKENRLSPTEVAGLDGVIQVVGGATHSLALRDDGTVWAWGNNGSGRLGLGQAVSESLIPVQVPGLSNVVELGAGCCHSIALQSDGTVWAWGLNSRGWLGTGGTATAYVPVQVPGLSGITTIAAGYDHTLAIASDGTIWAWGANWAGALGDGTQNDRYSPALIAGISGATSVAGGRGHTVAALADGTVWIWGSGWAHTPENVDGLEDATEVSAGNGFSLALRSDKTLWSWGNNLFGQLGDGTTTARITPLAVAGMAAVKSFATGQDYALAEISNGSVWAWGANSYGQLGDGTTVDRHEPTRVDGIGPGPIQLHMPAEALFIGSYAHVPITIDPSTGITLEDLDFIIPDGDQAGIISLSKDQSISGDVLMLVAGVFPGKHTIEVYEKATGSLVGTFEYSITTEWTDIHAGPSQWIMSEVPDDPFERAWGAYGGGNSGPQNLSVIPVSGTWRTAVVLVDTKSQRFDSGGPSSATARQNWIAVMNDLAEYIEEVSVGKLTLDVDVLTTVVHLPGDFDDYFDSSGKPGESAWHTIAHRAMSFAPYGAHISNLDSYDSVIWASAGVGNAKGDFAWPYAMPRSTYYGLAPLTQGFGIYIARFNAISMDFDWPARAGAGGRSNLDTAAHELLHNLGLADMYKPNTGRNVGNWDPMDKERGLPHISLAHKMMLGWVEKGSASQPGDVMPFNADAMSLPTNSTLRLAPSEHANPAPGIRWRGAEFRVADGLNWYFEYRSPDMSAIGDQSLPLSNRVLATEVVSYKRAGKRKIPSVQVVPLDADGDGQFLDTGDDFRAEDIDPMFPSVFSATMLGKVTPPALDRFAEVEFAYDVIGRPDPAIRPWPASKKRKYMSPDIKITNARSAADSQWEDTIFLGNPNTISATIRNNGGVDANGVVVKFSRKNLSPKADDYKIVKDIGSVVVDVPARGVAVAQIVWNAGDDDIPSKKPHVCIVVEIDSYTVPGTGLNEITVENNAAQSNYTRAVSSTASPWSRELRYLTVENVENGPQYVQLIASQPNPLYRTYLEHTWMLLGPGEVRRVALMSEYAGEEFLTRGGDPNTYETWRHETNDIAVRSILRDVADHSGDQGGGVSFQVAEGLATTVEGVSLVDFGNEARVSGRVVIERTGAVAPAGKLIVTFNPGRDDSSNATFDVPAGEFVVYVPSGWDEAKLYFVAPAGYADAETKMLNYPAP